MKKGLILTTALAMVLGVGVAVGAHHSEAKKVEAAGETTIYLDTNKLSWYGDQSRAYLYGTGGNNGWPGKALTHVSGSIYKLDVANMSNYQSVIFLRSNGTDVWNRTSKDGGVAINLPTNWATQNMWKFSDSWGGNEYDDGNYTGSWTYYEVPAVTYNVTCVVDGKAETPIEVGEGSLPDAKPNTYAKAFDGWYTASDYKTKITAITADCNVYGHFVDKATTSYTIDDGYAKKFDTYYLHAWNSDGDNGGWPGVELEGKTITIPTDASFIINDGDGQQTVNITQEGAKAYIKLLNTTDESGHYNVEWAASPTDVPASEGYYIKGSASSWAYTAANKMSTENLHEGDVAQFIGFDAKKDDEIRICSYYTNRAPFEQWASLENGTSEVGTLSGNNLKFSADGTYDIYAKYDNEQFLFSAFEHVEPTPDPVYTVKYYTYTFTFELDDEHKPEGADHQYKATIADCGQIWRTRTLEFFADDVKMTENIGVDYDMEEGEPVPGNNIVGDATNGFKVYTSNTSMDVYMKQYGSWFSLWGTAYAENTYYLSHSKGTLSLDEDFEPYGDYVKQYRTTNPVTIEKLNAKEEYENYYISDTLGGSQNINMETAGNNNAISKGLTYFDVHNTCTQVVYLKEKADLSLWLYIGGYEEAHVLTIGGQTVNLSNNGDGQYVAHGVALSAGDAVTSYTVEGTSVEVTSKKVANNNLTEGKTVLANVASADIYYNVEAKTLWISGLPAAGQHLLKNGNTAIEMTHTDPYEGYDQYASGMLTFEANDTIKVLDTGAEDSYPVTWCPSIVTTSTKLAGKFVYDSEKHEMKCVSTCSAAVYLKIKSGVDEVYFGDVPEYVEEAVDYVNHFKSVMSTVCGDSPNKKNNVEAGWSNLAGDFRALSEQAQAEVKLGGYSLVEEIQEFGERYIAIKQQHSDWDLENFLEWDIPSSGRFPGVELDYNSNNNMMVIIIAIAATSAIALTTLLVIKKRKHK